MSEYKHYKHLEKKAEIMRLRMWVDLEKMLTAGIALCLLRTFIIATIA